MPGDYVIDAERGLVISTGRGVVTRKDFVEHQARLLADPAFQPSFHQLIDLTAVTRVELSGHDIEDLASRPVFSASSRRAWLVPRPEIFGLVRMFQTYRELHGGGEQIRIFSGREEALGWLLGE